MGLDMYAYVTANSGEHDEYWENYDHEKDSSTVNKPRELAYWRKHPNLHGWMEKLWERKMNAEGRDSPHTFNGIELELNWEDLDELEQTVKNKELPATKGFFFGDDADREYYEQDLEFIKNARAELFTGLKVFYNSSW
jgi:hypothetical protein